MPRQSKTKNLDDYLNNVYQERRKQPAILTATSYDIELVSGLAIVSLTRRFQNEEARAIEAIMTFPVPFNAAVSKLEAVVDGRKLIGVASAKAQARETYESAIDDGKAAVLHEELLPGLHMVSVANVKPKTFIDVTARFVVPLFAAGNDLKLRIPLTVGQIYGNSPLSETDALIATAAEQFADVVIKSSARKLTLNGKPVSAGEHKVSLATLIDVGISDENLKTVSAISADGRAVTMTFERMATDDQDMEFDILLDASGSMDEFDASGRKKWVSMICALSQVETLGLRNQDKINLWTFSKTARLICRTSRASLAADLKNVFFERGGTELEQAVETVAESREAANILLLTDGKAHRLNLEKAIRQGARVTVVLMGAEALEAKVGYLAAMSGGQMFPCFGDDTPTMIAEAVRSMRGVSPPITMTTGRPQKITRTVGGINIGVEWKANQKKAQDVDGVSQLAAYLAIAGMETSQASTYAAEEGIVTHLTSIALVDDAGEAVNGIPAQRKVPLSEPAGGAQASMLGFLDQAPPPMMRGLSASLSTKSLSAKGLLVGALASFRGTKQETSHVVSGLPPHLMPAGRAKSKHPSIESGGQTPPELPDQALADILKSVGQDATAPAGWTLEASLKVNPIDWDNHGDDLLAENVKVLPLPIRARVSVIAGNAAVSALAARLSRSAISVAIGLIAYADKLRSRTADRIQRRLLKDVAVDEVDEILRQL